MTDSPAILRALSAGTAALAPLGGICRGLRASKKAPGESRIYTAGEKEYLAWQTRKDKGDPVGKGVQADLTSVRDALGLDYHFDFEDLA